MELNWQCMKNIVQPTVKENRVTSLKVKKVSEKQIEVIFKSIKATHSAHEAGNTNQTPRSSAVNFEIASSSLRSISVRYVI